MVESGHEVHPKHVKPLLLILFYELGYWYNFPNLSSKALMILEFKNKEDKKCGLACPDPF